MNELNKIDPMRVVIYAPGIPFDAETIATKSLGGSESAAHYQARAIAALGHAVVVFTTHETPKSGDGVTYAPIGKASQDHPLGHLFENYACNTPHDLLIVQRIAHGFHKPFAAKVTLWQLHDLALFRLAPVMMGGAWQIDAVTAVSEWHAQQVRTVWDINPERLRVVPNGVDQRLYSKFSAPAPALKVAYSEDREEFGFNLPDAVEHLLPTVIAPAGKFLLLFQSRPERGLGNALEVMEQARLIGLPLHLLVCAYENSVAHMAPMYDSLYARARSMENVTLLGALTKPQLAQLQEKCDLLFYPTSFEEVSCITAMEAMAAGLPMLTSAVGALPETCEGAGVRLLPLKDGQADLEGFLRALTSLFGLSIPGQYPEELQAMRATQFEAAKKFIWRVAAEKIVAVSQEALARKQSQSAILRNAIETSDIAFADWYLKTRCTDPSDESTPIVNVTRDEIDRLYAFAHSAEAFAAHYAKHQGAYYDGPGASAIGEDVTPTTRFRGVATLFAEHIAKRKARHLRVLDYGCAHGHYTMPLAKTFTTCDFVGMDISARAIEQAKNWAKRINAGNVEFVQGSQQMLATSDVGDRNGEGAAGDALGLFDVILAGEVLEHVWNYNELLALLRGRLAPEGVLIFTTPIGRWEHCGTIPFRSAREHMHHFERADIEDICRGHDSSILHAPAGSDRSGLALSSYVWAVWPTETLSLCTVDYERKLRQYAPRQTVSACMIVKDGEQNLRRSVESFIDWVDEIVICIDPATTDRTMQIVAQLQIDFPNRPFVYGVAEKSAMRDGFAEARNESIAKASGDWILWIDADEELRHPWAMHRFLRPALHNGYGWPQVHYSVDPETVLTTDFPCRLFRNGIGVKFYGFVHEHPEQILGQAIPWSIVRQEMKFLHHGYFDEETRRARFTRNYPLLMKDVAEHPDDRPINKFLHLRDLAQSIQFGTQQLGTFTEHHAKLAHLGIRIMEQIAEMPQVKMIADSMQYYSLCVSSLGLGFDAELTMKTKHPQAPDLAASLNFNGRFHSRAFFEKLVTKFATESIKHYDEAHL